MTLRLTKQRFERVLQEGKQKLEEERKNRPQHFSSHKIDPIPSIIYIMTDTTNAAADKGKKTGNTAGRPAGTNNFSVTELTHLFQAMEVILPIGSDQWNHLAQVHADKYPGRCLAAIRRKYNSFARQKTPTGDPLCPPFVKWAKRIKWKLANKVEVGHCEEPFDLVNGHPETYTEPEAVAPDPVPVPSAPAFAIATGTETDKTPSGITSGITMASATASKRSYSKTDTILESMNSEMKVAVAAHNERFDKLQESMVDLQGTLSSFVTALMGKKKANKKKSVENESDSDSDSDSDDSLSIVFKPSSTKTVKKRLGGKPSKKAKTTRLR